MNISNKLNEAMPLCEVAILAGGLGTRLKSRTGGLPKPMAPVLGRPVLEHLIDLCARHGFTRIALLVHYQSDQIRSYFGDGSQWGVALRYCVETEARGTAGALCDAIDELAERFLVLYGDTYADLDLARVWNTHCQGDAAATLVLHPNDHPQDSDLVEIDDVGRVHAIHPYPHRADACHRNLVNAALYAMQREAVRRFLPSTGKADLAKHTFSAMLAAGAQLQSYVTPEYIKDMGTPERLDKVERDIRSGLVDRLSSRRQRRAVFLDRDGTLNLEVGHLKSPVQLQLLPGSGDAVRALNRAGYLAVCVTNQPVVARGDVTAQELDRIHAALDQQLGACGAYLDALYHCPHHPDAGFPNEVRALKRACHCRKPGTQMIDRAVSALDVNRGASWMVGDTSSDMLAGRRAGLRTILVRTGHGGMDGKYGVAPDFEAPDLASAVDWVLHGHPAMLRQLMGVLEPAVGARLVLVGGPARAGKSSAARCLAELMAAAGRRASIVALDGWLKPIAQRMEGQGVLQRYDMGSFTTWLRALLSPDSAYQPVRLPAYDRASRSTVAGETVTVAPDDVLIVEGVPALLVEDLVRMATVRLYVDVDDAVRHNRLRADLGWRQTGDPGMAERLALREQDELPTVRASAGAATHRLCGAPLTPSNT